MRGANGACVLATILLSSCCHDDYRARDERTVRKDLMLPVGAELVALEGLPNDPHLMQREGLRIDATFKLDAEARKDYHPLMAGRFQPVPVPAAVSSFSDTPPPDMLGANSGHFYCQARVYASNSNSVAAVYPCDKAPANYQAYILATYDERTGIMRVWLKHMF